MVNNPFRCKPKNVQQNIEDWGKSKFKPTKFKGNGYKAFKNNKPLNNRKDNNFHKNKETNKFNEVAKYAKPENATPWNKYKCEIVYKQREEEQSALQANMESNEAKTIMKQREINYRKSIIDEKKREPIIWEDFGDEQRGHRKNKKKLIGVTENEGTNSNKQNDHSKRKLNKNQTTTESKLNTQTKTKFKEKISNSELKFGIKELISKELLDNFDSKKLNYIQNNKLRSTITKTAIMASGCSLERVVKDMKIKKEKLSRKAVK